MLDILPRTVIARIQDHYRRIVPLAEANYESSEAEEDAITGALGQAMEGTQTVDVGEDNYIIRTTYHKFGGRGPGALERATGADGIFQIEVRDSEGNIIRRKSLPFQAKKNRTGSSSRLRRQASTLIAVSNTGIVIIYSENGYYAVPAETVVEAEGRLSGLPQNSVSRLGKTLAEDFVPCHIGRLDMFYDPFSKRLIFTDSTGRLIANRFPIDHGINTVVTKRRGWF